MKRVLIYGGTTEGRRLAEKLAEAGIPSLVLVATEYGEQMMAPPNWTFPNTSSYQVPDHDSYYATNV